MFDPTKTIRDQYANVHKISYGPTTAGDPNRPNVATEDEDEDD